MILLPCWLAALGLFNISPVAAANVDHDKRWPTRSIDIVICDGQSLSSLIEFCKPQVAKNNSSSRSLNDYEATTIREALDSWNAKFFQNIELREVRRPAREGLIVFRASSQHRRCSTKRVGYSSIKPINYISIGSQCNVSQKENRTNKGVVIHEILHAIGFYHEQERTDREKYLSIRDGRSGRVPWGLDCRRKAKNCTKGKRGDRIGRYDFSSIMHYSRDGQRASSSRLTLKGHVKLARINAGAHEIGQRDGLSSGDIDAIRTLYPTQ